MAVKRIVAGLILMCIATASVHSELTPLWSMQWLDSHPLSSTSRVISVVASDSNAILAAYDVQLAQQVYARFLVVNGDGSLAWVHEDDVPSAAISAGFRPDGQIIAVTYRDGSGSGLLSVRLLAANDGGVVWEVTTPLLDNPSAVAHAHRLAIDAAGTAYVVQGDGGSYSILRIDVNGNRLPDWRWKAVSDIASPTDISALPDGGVIVTGFGSLGEGYRTVRLDSKGDVLFSDVEGGELGNPLGSSSVVATADGNFLLAATAENLGGVPRLRIWKLSPTGIRLWTAAWGDSNATIGLQLGGLAMSSDGDAIAAVSLPPGSAVDAVGLLRFDGHSGNLSYANFWPGDALHEPWISGVAIAGNNRIATSVLSFDGTAHVFEWTPDGRACRRADPANIDRITVSAAGIGWVALSKVVNANHAKIVVQRFDAGAPCDVDVAFRDSFELVGH